VSLHWVFSSRKFAQRAKTVAANGLTFFHNREFFAVSDAYPPLCPPKVNERRLQFGVVAKIRRPPARSSKKPPH
jgi:hypothetical protein